MDKILKKNLSSFRLQELKKEFEYYEKHASEDEHKDRITKRDILSQKYHDEFSKPFIEKVQAESDIVSASGMSSSELKKIKGFDELEVTTKYFQEIITSLKTWTFKDKGMYFYGNCGTGKTSLVEAMKKELVFSDRLKPKSVRSWSCTVVMDKLKKFENDAAGRFMTYLSRQDLIIMDDFGANMGTEFEISCILNILNNRIDTKNPMFMTSNLSPVDIQNKFGDRILDRIQELMLVVKVPGNESYRRKIQAKERAKRGLH